MTDISDSMKGPVLLVEDIEGLIGPLEKALKQVDISVAAFTDSSLAMEEIRNGLNYRLAVIASYPAGNSTGSEILHESKRIHPSIPVLVITDYSENIPWAIDGVIRKPVKIPDFVGLVLYKLSLQR